MQINEKIQQLKDFLPRGWVQEISKRCNNVSEQTIRKFFQGGDVRYVKAVEITKATLIFYNEYKTIETTLIRELMSEGKK